MLALSMLSRKIEVEAEKYMFVLENRCLFSICVCCEKSKCEYGLMMCETLVDLSVFIDAETFAFMDS